MSKILPRLDIEAFLAKQDGWTLSDDGTALKKTFLFGTFKTAFEFMSAVADKAEALNHHPDWSNSYARVVVRLTTHDAGAVTELDIKLAEAMDVLAAPSVRLR